MRVVLEVLSGPDAGRKTRLGASQVLQVGRTEWADFSLARDGHMSGVHFALETDNTACYIKDLGSSNGTLLNGRSVTDKAVVGDGDEIRAGETLFTVHIDGAASQPATPASAQPIAERSPAAVVPAPTAAAVSRAAVSYQAETCDSELTRYHGSVDKIRPGELAVRLGQAVPLHVILELNKLEMPLPEGLAQPEYLMDWLPEEARAKYSPIVLSASDQPDLFSVIEAGWGKDAMIGIYSKEAKPALLERVRPAAGAFVRPSVLAPQLTAGAPAFVGKLLSGIDAVLVEGESPAQWNLLAKSEFEQTLDTLGFVRQEATRN